MIHFIIGLGLLLAGLPAIRLGSEPRPLQCESRLASALRADKR